MNKVKLDMDALGMGCDNLLEATIVTAAGCVVTVKATDDPDSDKGKFFRALCGAGSGNFGFVVGSKMKVSKVKTDDGLVVSGRFACYPESNDANSSDDLLISTMQSFYRQTWSDRMAIDSTWDFDHRLPNLQMGGRFTAYYDGSKEAYDQEIKSKIQNKELASFFAICTKVQKSSQWLMESIPEQWKEDKQISAPEAKSWTIFSSFAFNLTDAKKMEAITSVMSRFLKLFCQDYINQKVHASCTFIHTGGAASRRAKRATAFCWREDTHLAYIQIQGDDSYAKKELRSFLTQSHKHPVPSLF